MAMVSRKFALKRAAYMLGIEYTGRGAKVKAAG